VDCKRGDQYLHLGRLGGGPPDLPIDKISEPKKPKRGKYTNFSRKKEKAGGRKKTKKIRPKKIVWKAEKKGNQTTGKGKYNNSPKGIISSSRDKTTNKGNVTREVKTIGSDRRLRSKNAPEKKGQVVFAN